LRRRIKKMIIHKKDVPAFCEFLRNDLTERERDLLKRIEIVAAPVGVRPEGEGWMRLSDL